MGTEIEDFEISFAEAVADPAPTAEATAAAATAQATEAAATAAAVEADKALNVAFEIPPDEPVAAPVVAAPVVAAPVVAAPVVAAPVVAAPVVAAPVVAAPVVAAPVVAAPVVAAPVVAAPVVAAPVVAAPVVAAPVVEEPKFDAPFVMTEEDTAAVALLNKDWGETAAGVGVLLRKQQHELEMKFAAALYETVKHVATIITPAVQGHQMTAQEKHNAAIKDAHSDFAETLPKVEAWVATQPAYLKTSMEQVLEGGSAEEVIHLFSHYKKDAGIVTPPVVVVTAAVAPAAVIASDPAVAAAAAALAPVQSGKATPIPGAGVVDKEDYAGAFAEATAS